MKTGEASSSCKRTRRVTKRPREFRTLQRAKLTSLTKCAMLRLSYLSIQAAVVELSRSSGLQISRSTFKNKLREFGIAKWPSREVISRLKAGCSMETAMLWIHGKFHAVYQPDAGPRATQVKQETQVVDQVVQGTPAAGQVVVAEDAFATKAAILNRPMKPNAANENMPTAGKTIQELEEENRRWKDSWEAHEQEMEKMKQKMEQITRERDQLQHYYHVLLKFQNTARS